MANKYPHVYRPIQVGSMTALVPESYVIGDAVNDAWRLCITL